MKRYNLAEIGYRMAILSPSNPSLKDYFINAGSCLLYISCCIGLDSKKFLFPSDHREVYNIAVYLCEVSSEHEAYENDIYELVGYIKSLSREMERMSFVIEC